MAKEAQFYHADEGLDLKTSIKFLLLWNDVLFAYVCYHIFKKVDLLTFLYYYCCCLQYTSAAIVEMEASIKATEVLIQQKVRLGKEM